jgi:hypothetical protein
MIVEDHPATRIPSHVRNRLRKVGHDVVDVDEFRPRLFQQWPDVRIRPKAIQEVVTIREFDDRCAVVQIFSFRFAFVMPIVVVVEHRIKGRRKDSHRVPMLPVVLDEQILLELQAFVVELADHYDSHGFIASCPDRMKEAMPRLCRTHPAHLVSTHGLARGPTASDLCCAGRRH